MAVGEIGLLSTLEGLPAQMQRLLADLIPQIVWSARAEAVGGRLSIERVDPGTRILVTVPLGDADQRNSR